MVGMFGMPGHLELLLVAVLGLGCIGVVVALVVLVAYLNKGKQSPRGRNLVQCPDCQRSISPSAVSCPHCGRPNDTVKGK